MPLPVVRVALTWFFFLAGLGVFFPYGSWYLSRTLGLSGGLVGLVLAVPPLVGLIAQPAWGHLADRTGRRTRVLWIIGLGASASYLLVALPSHTAPLLAAMALFAVFTSSIVPSLWAVTMALLGAEDLKHVGWARVAGTLGFGATALSFPAVLTAVDAHRGSGAWWQFLFGSVHPDGAGLRILFPIAAICVACGALLAMSLPRTGAVGERAERGMTRAVLSDARFLRMLVVVFLAFLFLQGPMVLFPMLVHAQGGDLDAIARMWLLMLALEVPLVAAFGWTVGRLGLPAVIGVGLAAGAVRWLISGFSEDLGTVVAAQLLHGVTVWGVVLGLPALVDTVVPPSLRSTAQGVLAMVGFGVGTLASNLASGLLVDAWGATAPARVGGIGTAVLALGLPWLLPGRHDAEDAAA
jgi:MFS transporter, PPP family, 3-phenylpropionic acid transporter